MAGASADGKVVCCKSLSYCSRPFSQPSLDFSQRGIPVATVAINNGTNAGLLAVRILTAGIPELVDSMDQYLKNLESEVMAKVVKLDEVGWEAYEVKR